MAIEDQDNPASAGAIGKTRQQYDAAAGPPRGILRRTLPEGVFGHSRRTPAATLTPWILHYWLVDWELPTGIKHTVETLPHPNVQLVFTSGEAPQIHGVQTAKFTRVLQGRARVFGVKFSAGGFRPFLGRAVTTLRDKTVAAREVFGPEIERLSPLLTSDAPELEKIEAANRFFNERKPTHDPDAEAAAELVALILANPEIRTVAAAAAHTSVRRTQRLFREYVGVSPKWVIRRYRMHELVERLNTGERLDWAATAVDLGYFDQSHLIRDFRRLTGYAPEQYRGQAMMV